MINLFVVQISMFKYLCSNINIQISVFKYQCLICLIGVSFEKGLPLKEVANVKIQFVWSSNIHVQTMLEHQYWCNAQISMFNLFDWAQASGMRMGCHKRRLQISLLAQQKLYCPPPFWELCGENFRLNAEKIQIFHVPFWIRNNTALLLFESQQVKGVHLMFVRFSAVWRKIHIEPKIAYWAEIILPSSFSCQKHLTYKTLFTPGPKALEALSAS